MFSIKVSNLGKAYYPGKRAETIVDEMRRLAMGRLTRSEKFWALRDVSLEVAKGEFLAIVGRNGAGKSTLLKILSGITEPTTGEAQVVGNVGSLLELGIGFHPDLTGRENIYMCAGVLGGSRRLIQERFDEIVEFAGIGEFLDTAIRYYSSGMAVRLGFSIASHMDQDILIIDEALSVGDVEFQHKSWRLIEELLSSGTTVLLVSHNSSMVSECQRALYLEHGQVKDIGLSQTVLEHYLSDVAAAEAMESGNGGPGPDHIPQIECS